VSICLPANLGLDIVVFEGIPNPDGVDPGRNCELAPGATTPSRYPLGHYALAAMMEVYYHIMSCVVVMEAAI
jgi:hypothetical protein